MSTDHSEGGARTTRGSSAAIIGIVAFLIFLYFLLPVPLIKLAYATGADYNTPWLRVGLAPLDWAHRNIPGYEDLIYWQSEIFDFP